MCQGHFQVIHHSDTCCVVRYWQPLAGNLIAQETLTMMDLRSAISQAPSNDYLGKSTGFSSHYQHVGPFAFEAREKEKQLITRSITGISKLLAIAAFKVN